MDSEICLKLNFVHATWLWNHMKDLSDDLSGELDLISEDDPIDAHFLNLISEKTMADLIVFKLEDCISNG